MFNFTFLGFLMGLLSTAHIRLNLSHEPRLTATVLGVILGGVIGLTIFDVKHTLDIEHKQVPRASLSRSISVDDSSDIVSSIQRKFGETRQVWTFDGSYINIADRETGEYGKYRIKKASGFKVTLSRIAYRKPVRML